MRNVKVVFDSEKLQYSVELMRALSHPLRMLILEFIDEQEVTNVNKIYKALNIEQSITSQHLRVLKNAGIVSAEKEGKYVFYRINYPVIHKAVESVNAFLNS